MKKISLILLAMACTTAWMACNNAQARYIDLNSGETIMVVKDEHGRLVNKQDMRPVRFYIDAKTKDTLDGRTGKVVNGELVKFEDEYEYISVREALASDDDFKKKVEKDGDVKIKSGDKKIKIDGKTGEKKVKTGK